MKKHMKNAIALAFIGLICYWGLKMNDTTYTFLAYYTFGGYVLYLLWDIKLFQSIYTLLRDRKRIDIKVKRLDH